MKLLYLSLSFVFVFLFYTLYATPYTLAATNPLSVPNNKYGIHIISATTNDASESARLVNNNGDWGYITVLIEAGDRNEGKWQEFFNDLRRRHLIPLVRLATKPSGDSGVWERPYEGEEKAWADFLDKLIWPTKNRYIIIYNEPNHASEWGGTVDPEGFAVSTNRTIDALRAKSEDFFILNAGFDSSTPNEPPKYLDQEEFMNRMNAAIPGIFNKFDGWVSHSYPNPGFKGKPYDYGRGTVRNWEWEQTILNKLGVSKVLPIFITETGWKHLDGVTVDNSLPDPETVADYFKQAFAGPWSNNRIVAVTPFLLNYQDAPFDHFSFKKIEKNKSPEDTENYYPAFKTIADLPKQKGKPVQTEAATLTKLGIEKDGFVSFFEASQSGTLVSLTRNEPYTLNLTFRNTGQTIWSDGNDISLTLFGGGPALETTRFELPEGVRIEPNQEVSFKVPVSPLEGGKYELSFNFFNGLKPLMTNDYLFNIEVKAPVFVKISASLKWKENFGGEYVLGILGQLRYALSATQMKAVLNKNGQSEQLETNYLLPDQQYTFILEKPYYKSKTVSQIVTAGENEINFGELQPDLRSAILKPVELWRLLPFSN